MFRKLLLLVVIVMMASPASAAVILQVDFNSNQDGGGDSSLAGDPGLSAAAHNQAGWSSYHANHEVAAEFSTADYGGITVTPAWPNTTDNRVQQSIDRGTGNDNNWDDAAGDLNLVTDFLGIDTRTGNGGNGNWDGSVGTPTYMTLTIGGLPAASYEWTSFHHDTEHCHGSFAVWISTNGGATFTQLTDGVMTDSTTGGTPDSGATEDGPDAFTLPSTYRTSFNADGANDVVLRFAPYSATAVHRQIWGINGFQLEMTSSDQALKPIPGNGDTDVAKSVILSWTPGDSTATTNGHKIFFSDDFADVNDGWSGAEVGVVSDPEFDTALLPFDLDYGTTYYWRVDQASTPGGPWLAGEVWSFTVEPYSFVIPGDSISASASSVYTGSDPNSTINGAGLAEDDTHSTEESDMWLSDSTDPGPVSIEYEFDRAYRMHEMLVWNHNSIMETAIGLGIKEAVIEYSVDGESWTKLGTTHEFNQATGSSDYTYNTAVDLAGVVAKYIRITANSGWKDILGQYGLSEVRFFYIPVWARLPEPDSGAADQNVDGITLSWRPGREATSSDLFLSTDRKAVINETADVYSIPLGEGFDTGGLDLGETYYWKVNSVSDIEDPAIWPGDLWSFDTQEYLVVDDMTNYGDVDEMGVPGGRAWFVWRDGEGWATPAHPASGGNGTGSVVDWYGPEYYESDKSLWYAYESDGTNFFGTAGKAYYSEATANVSDLPIGSDWAAAGIRSMSLYFNGDPNNDVEPLYVKLNGAKVPYDGDMADIADDEWHEWNIDLSQFGINLQSVTSMTIGIGDDTNTQPRDAGGIVLFDDIRLHPGRCFPSRVQLSKGDLNSDCVVDYLDVLDLAGQWLTSGHLVTPTQPGNAGLVAHWTFDDGAGTTAQDSSGNNNHGTVNGDAQWVAAGKVGGALAFDGVDDMVVATQNIGLPIYNNGVDNAYSITMWVKGGPQNDMRVFSEGSTTSNTPLFNLGTQNAGATGQFDVYIRPDEGATLNHPHSQAEPFDETWHHVAWVDANGTASLYVDGVLDGTDFSYARGTMALDTTTIGGILRANPSHWFTGEIDDVRVYSRALSYGEVAGLAGRTEAFSTPADMNVDGAIDFKDFAILGDSWLDEQLWPQP